MNSLIFSLFVLILFCFHKLARPCLLTGKVREYFCALWCIDTIFCICGIIISFHLYQYQFFRYLTWNNLLYGLFYLILTVLFILVSPSGFLLFTTKKSDSAEELSGAEYRFHDTLLLVRRFFMIMLFLLPILLNLISYGCEYLSLPLAWTTEVICGGFCFIAFFVLLPISLRQSFFWLKNLRNAPSESETLLLKSYIAQDYYQRRNGKL